MAMIHLEPQTAQMFSRALGALKPPPNLTLSQWADNYRRLSAEASAAQGRWNTDNAPFQREIMDAIGDVHIRKVVAMMCAQSGKTDGLILNTIGYYMSYYPAPIMIVQPTVNLGESFSKDRLATMIRDTPVLRGLVDNKSRYSGNTIMKKNFAGGQLTIVGANAPTDLRGRPIKVLLADEVDAYKASAGKEGDPVMLAEQRQTTYWDYKTVLVSTPTDKNNSRILDEFNASTQEEWTVPCPNCGFYQPFVWDNMVFDKDKWPEGGVQYRCAECGCLDNEYRWKKNSLKGKWHAEHPERAVRGFHMNKIGSTLCGWDKIVEDFIAADLDAQRGDYEKMQVFVNTDLGLATVQRMHRRVHGIDSALILCRSQRICSPRGRTEKMAQQALCTKSLRQSQNRTSTSRLRPSKRCLVSGPLRAFQKLWAICPHSRMPCLWLVTPVHTAVAWRKNCLSVWTQTKR